tara:strand:+ start:571 stop:720 length:150 start_codon:yes stop_codon:yes gene_type:complete
MSDRVRMTPPAGGEAIEVYAEDAERLIANGWKKAGEDKTSSKETGKKGA